MLTPCGVLCEKCSAYISECEGCRELSGRVSWVSFVDMEVCPMYDCSVNERDFDGCRRSGTSEHKKSCSGCVSLPCRLYFDTRNPSVSEAEHEKQVAIQVERLKAQE